MKRFYKFLMPLVAIVAMALPVNVVAQTLTVANGTTTNTYVPIYGYYCDADQHNQVVYPASMLADMTNNYITSMSFYQQQVASSSWGTTVTIKLMEITDSVLTDLVATTGATTVFTGTVNGTNAVETFVFTTPFEYQGGNLLVDITTTASTYSENYWYGVTRNGASVYVYGDAPLSEIMDGDDGEVQNFLPKTTFIYNATGTVCYAPSNFAVAVAGDTATFTWTDTTGSAWEIVYGAVGFNPDNATNVLYPTSSPFEVDGIAVGMYEAYIRTDCSGDYSAWVGPVSFGVGVITMNMATSGTQTISTCNATIYDDGGPTGSYSPYCQSTLIITPEDSLHYVSVSGSSYTEDTYDYLTIYDGVGTSGEELWTDYGISATTNFGPFVGEAITVVFHSDGSIQYSGFEINVQCVAAPTCHRPGSFTVAQVNPRSVEFTWTDNEATEWAIAYGPAGFTVGDANTLWANFTDTYGTITGLTPETSYDFYLMAVCGTGEGDTSRALMASATTIPSCAVLTGVSVVTTTGNALLSWTPSVSDPECQALVEYKLATDATWNPAVVATGTTYTLVGLTAGTDYNARVAALCANGDTSNWVSVNFSTKRLGCLDFDTTQADTLIFSNSTSGQSGCLAYSSWGNTVYQTIYTAAELAEAGLSAGPITGIDLGFTASSSYAKEFTIFIDNSPTTSINNATIETPHNQVYGPAAHPTGTSGWQHYDFDTVFVWDGSSSIMLTTFMNQPTGTSQTSSSGLTGYYVSASNKARFRYRDGTQWNLSNLTAGNSGSTYSYRAAIHFYTYGCMTPASCAAPAGSLTHVGADTVTVSWIPGASETSWDVEYRRADTNGWTSAATGVTATEFSFVNLSPATEYYFRVLNICGIDTFACTLNATTTCMPYSIPFYEDFNSMGVTTSATEINCWNHVGGGYVNITSGYSITGNGLRFYPNSSSAGNILVLPEMSVPISQLELMFSTRPEGSSSGSIGVGYITNVNDASTFVQLASYAVADFPTTSTWLNIVQNFTGAPVGARIALRHNVNSTSWYWFIDDIEVNRYSTCPRVQNVTVTGVTNNAANISWQSPDSVLSCTLFWGTANDVTLATDSVVLNATNYSFASLDGNTTYYVWVSNDCDYEPSALVATSFTTYPDCGAVENLTVRDVTSSTATIAWNPNTIGNPATSYSVTVVSSSATVYSAVVNNNYVFLTGLDSLTSYNVTVTAYCGTDDSSASAYTSFTTASTVCNVVGTGTSTYYYPVSYSTYQYSYMQVLYLSTDLNMMGDTINGITLTASVTDSVNVPLTVYIGLSDRTDLYTSEMLQPADMALVYNGTMTFHNGACYIPFTTPFVRDASRNIIVAFDNNSGVSLSGLTFAYTQTGPYYVNFSYGATDINPVGAEATNVTTYRPNIEFDASCATCASPSIVVTETTESTISIAWSGSANSYNVKYCIFGDTTWSVAATALTTNAYTITGLMTGIQYYVKVEAACTDGNSVGKILTVTSCGDVAVPYTENFDYYANNDFTRPCWNYGTVPYVSNLVVHGPMMRLAENYVTLPHFDAQLNELQVRFKYVCSDTVNNPYVLFGYVTNPEDINTLVVVDTIDYAATSPIDLTLSLGSLGDDVDGYIAFYRPAQTSTYYSFFDNLFVEYIPACVVPTNVVASNITANGATISWSAGSEMATAYRVLYKKYADNAFDTLSAAGTSINLTGLDHSSTYQVYIMAMCDSLNAESTLSQVCQFNTECADYTVLPYTMNFDNEPVPANYETGMLPNCWTIVSTTATSASERPQIYYDNSYAYNGGYSLRMYYNSVVAMPHFTTQIDSLQVSFNDYVTSTDYAIVVGVVDSLTPTATFHPADTVVFDQSGSNAVVSYLTTAGVTDGYIAFKNIYVGSYGYSYSYNYLDNIEVSLAPSCLPVTNITAVLDSASSITLDWRDPRPATEWQIAYSTSPLTDPLAGTVVNVNSHPYEVTGLTDDSSYYFYIRNVCGAGDSSAWAAYGPARCHVFNMRANQTDTVYMCGGTLYDDGGPNGNYSNSQDSYIIVMPSDGSSLVQLTGNVNTETCCDRVIIYDGIGTTGAQLFYGYGSVNVTSISGPLTVLFHTDGSVNNYDGFTLNVSCLADECPVSDLRVDPTVPATANSVAITWNGTSTAYEVEYGNGDFAHGAGTSVTTSSNSYVITGLNAMTNYNIYVRGICNAGDTGLWHKLTYSTPMCDNVAVIENWDSTMNSTTSSYGPIGYSLYNYSYVQTIIDSADMAVAGGDITALGFMPASTSAGSYFTNMDVYMANVSESVISDFILPDTAHQFVHVIHQADFSYTSTDWQIHGFDTAFTWDGHSNVLVAVNRQHGSWTSGSSFAAHTHPSVTGGYKMVYDYQDGSPYDITTASDANGSNNVGDIRLFSCGSSCAAPAVNITAHDYQSASITAVGSGLDYELVYGTDIAALGNAMTSATGAFTITGLTPNTQYFIGVRQQCDSATWSDYSIVNFTTDDLPCFAPTDLNVVATTFASATLGWTSSGSATTWAIELNGAGLQRFDTVGTNPYTITGLYANQQYTAAVRAICLMGTVESDWSDTITFTTDACAPVQGVAVSGITANSATVSWMANNGVMGYKISYGDSNFYDNEAIVADVDANTTSYTMTGLEEESAYEVYVQTKCAEGIYSVVTAADRVSFRTTAGGSEGIYDAESGTLTLFPNPASTSVTVTVSGMEGEVTVEIVDLNGRTSGKWTVESGKVELDLSGMAQGAYFVRVTGERQTVVRKLIVR